MFEKDMRISLLLDFYGEILSEHRRELIELYYNDDLSLSEIADLKGISRQGVRDSVKKSARELNGLEEKLGLAKRFEKIKGETAEVSAYLASLSDENLALREKLQIAIERLSSLSI